MFDFDAMTTVGLAGRAGGTPDRSRDAGGAFASAAGPLVTLVTLAAVGVAAASPAYAVDPVPGIGSGWTSAVTVVDPDCQPDFVSAAAAAGPDQVVHGFASYVRGSCTGDPVWYFQGSGGRWSQVRSPYHGDVLATADDGTATWLLYLDGDSYDRVLLARRLHTGRWLPAETVSMLEGSAVASGVQGAGLVATGGGWWAVWAQALPDPLSSSPSTVLFQAKTLGGVAPAKRITDAPMDQQETGPDLALVSDQQGRPAGAVLAWARDVGGAATTVQNDELLLARSGLAGAWSSQLCVPAPEQPQAVRARLAVGDGGTWLAWQRQDMDPDAPSESRVLVTPAVGCARSPHMFATAGSAPVITTSGSRVDVAWRSTDPTRIAVATLQARRWYEETVTVTTGDTWGQHPLLITVVAGKATVVVQSREAAGRLLAVSQR